MLVEILVYAGVDELDTIGPFEVLSNARAVGAILEVRMVALDDSPEITCSHGLRFQPDGLIGSRGRPDILVAPGGGWAKRTAPGAWTEAQRGVIPQAIARLYKEGAVVARSALGRCSWQQPDWSVGAARSRIAWLLKTFAMLGRE